MHIRRTHGNRVARTHAHRAPFRWLIAAATAFALLASLSAAAAPTSPGLTADERRLLLDSPRVGSSLVEALDREERVSVVIVFDVPGAPAERGKARFGSAAARAALESVRNGIERGFAPGQFRARARYERINALVGEIDARGVLELLKRPQLQSVDVEPVSRLQLAQTLPLVGASYHHDYDVTGEGVTVAVLDSGIDPTHVDIAPRVVEERCFCTGCCPNGSNEQSGSGAAADDFGHGTVVTGVIASQGTESPKGMAPQASIVAVKIADSTGAVKLGDELKAYNWLLQRGGVDIVNTSFGEGAYGEYCDGRASLAASGVAVDQLTANGTLVVSSSGNDGHTDGIVAPGCLQNTLAVGSTYDADVGSANYPVCADATTRVDEVPCYSNSSRIVDLVAPGAMITTTKRGGGSVTTSGTSLSAPVVAGCAALLKQADRQVTPAELRARLTDSPFHVRDPKTPYSFPRLHCTPDPIRSRTTVLTGGPVPGGTGFIILDYDPVTRTLLTSDDLNSAVRFYEQDTSDGSWPLDRTMPLPVGASWPRLRAYRSGTLMLGYRKDELNHPEQGAVEVRQRTETGWITTDVIRPTDARPYQRFGTPLMLSDDGASALISANNRTEGSYLTVDVENYVFRQSPGGAWEQEAKLPCWDCGPAEYATAQCYDGDTAVLIRSDGWAYVFRRSGSDWAPEGKVGGFGTVASCDVDGDHLILGVPGYEDTSANPPGKVFFYERDPESATWEWAADFYGDAGSPATSSGLGLNPQLEGNLAAASNPIEDQFGIAGATYVYERRDGSWRERRKFTEDPTRQPWSAQERSDRNFGMRLALGPDVLLIEDKSNYHWSHQQNVPTDIYVFEFERCGDGVLDLHLGEVCDDGNADAGDGCSASCQVEGNACQNGLDDDGDRVADVWDPGCTDPADFSERSADPCDDGVDNDGDELIDSPEDPGCPTPTHVVEDPVCDDGVDNEGDELADWKGAGGLEKDPVCVTASHPRESFQRAPSCGMGIEVVPALSLLAMLRRRRRA